VLTAAALLPDLLWSVFLLAGLERVQVEPGNTAMTPLAFVHYPISHSLLTTAMWAALLASIYYAVSRYRRGALIAGVAVLSHWFLDALAHRPDLPLYPGAMAYAGLGLWNSVPGTIVVEVGMFIAGVWLYARRCHAGIRLWVFVAFLLAVYAANVTGPPPPNARAVAVVGLASWLLPVWAEWVDRGRS
jgi:membrane-bound metal-dependent hydrolase YbcI (DUF457 family)